MWSADSVSNVRENPVMTIPNQEKNQYLTFDRMAARYTVETWIRVGTHEGDHRVGTLLLEEQVYTLHRTLPLHKTCGNERSSVNLS